jgi:hypothetical protein
MGRIEKLRSGLDVGSMTGVEIGPLLQPVVTKSEGDIIYVDHLDTESLKAKYADDPNVDVSKIVSVDAVWGSQTLLQAVGRSVDYVIASHVAEHVPALVSWLAEIRGVLRAAGTLRLTVPDKRFTFDIDRRETALVDVLAAYVVKARTPLPRAIIDVVLHDTTVDLTAVWDGRYQPEKRSCDVAWGSNLPATRRRTAPIVTCIVGSSRRLVSAVFLSAWPLRAWYDIDAMPFTTRSPMSSTSRSS